LGKTVEIARSSVLVEDRKWRRLSDPETSTVKRSITGEDKAWWANDGGNHCRRLPDNRSV